MIRTELGARLRRLRWRSVRPEYSDPNPPYNTPTDSRLSLCFTHRKQLGRRRLGRETFLDKRPGRVDLLHVTFPDVPHLRGAVGARVAAGKGGGLCVSGDLPGLASRLRRDRGDCGETVVCVEALQ